MSIRRGKRTWRYLGSFYLPLAFTGVVNLAAQPLFTFGIALSRDSLDSLAVWPVIYAFLMIFITVVSSYQEIVVALYRSNEKFGLFKTFTLRLGSISSSLFLPTALLTLELLSLTKLPMIVLSLTPACIKKPPPEGSFDGGKTARLFGQFIDFVG